MPEIKALFVDMDGTLVDTAEANYCAYAEALAEAGVAVSQAEFEEVASGRNWRHFLPQLLINAERPVEAGQVAERKKVFYRRHLGKIRVNSALVSFVAGRASPTLSALVTTASNESATAILQMHALRPLFDVVVTGDDVTRHKPDPEAYLLASNRLGVAPSEGLAFEDSDPGVASALAAGLQVLRVSF